MYTDDVTPDIEKIVVKNTSGGTLAKGTVVVFKRNGVADKMIGKEVTTTTTLGDVRVAGILMQTLANGDSGECLRRGFCNYATTGAVGTTVDLAIGASATAGKVDYITVSGGATEILKPMGWAVETIGAAATVKVYVDL